MSVSKRIEGVCFIRTWPEDRGSVTYWCPGCDGGHTIHYGTDETWQWNGDAVKPTFSPSVLVYPHERSFEDGDPERKPARPQLQCHSFVRDGRIEYLEDSEHALAGTTVDMVPLPDRYRTFLAG